MSLKDTEALGQLWRNAGCDIMHATRFENDTPWVASLWRRADTIRDEHTSALAQDSSIWQITPGKLNCLMDEQRVALPATTIQSVDYLQDKRAYLYSAGRSAARTEDGMSVNLGWSLTALEATPAVTTGGTITVAHIWHIDSLPAEPFDSWYFAPNVKLTDADGRVVSEQWGKAISGFAWRTGDDIYSSMSFQAPIDAKPGAYTLVVSLFDPNQKKNAVYFSSARPGEPILALKRTVQLVEHN